MALENYNGSVTLISGIKQANNGSFPLVEASAVQVDEDDTRLDEALAALPTKGVDVTSVLNPAENVAIWIDPDGESDVEPIDQSDIETVVANAIQAMSQSAVSSEISRLDDRIDAVCSSGNTLPSATNDSLGKFFRLTGSGNDRLYICLNINGTPTYVEVQVTIPS